MHAKLLIGLGCVFTLVSRTRTLVPSHVHMTLFDNIDYSVDENRIYQYYMNHNEITWIWSTKSVCRTMCPRRMGVNHEHTIVESIEVLLRAQGCLKLEVEALRCSCETRRQGPIIKHATVGDYYINGPNGEIYELRTAGGACGDTKTLTIFDRIVGTSEKSAYLTPLPKLWGVARTFEARNVIRTGWRERNAELASGRFVVFDFEDEYV